MAKVAFKKGLLANLPEAISEGTFYITTDEHAMYLDVDGTTVCVSVIFRSLPP